MKIKPWKAINTQAADAKYIGSEPEWDIQPSEDSRTSALGRAFAWYSYNFSNKEAKQWLLEWLYESEHADLVKLLVLVPDRNLIPTYGWLARMARGGLVLTEQETARVLTAVKSSIEQYQQQAEQSSKEEKVDVVARPNVQEIMRERALEAGGELEGVFDDMILLGAKSGTAPGTIAILAAKNILPQHVSMLKEVWVSRATELRAALSTNDEDLVEGYSNFNKIQLKNLISFCDTVCAELDAYTQSKRATKTVRKKKPVPVEKQVAKIKYLKQSPELEITSLPPTKIVGATELWLYNNKTRKLSYYIADSHQKTFTVKGNSILGFDTAASVTKTLRKPKEQLAELVKAGKPAARKLFTDIKAVSTKNNGRFNENLVIVKVG